MAVAGLIACQQRHPEANEPAPRPGDTAVVMLALAQVPADVRCLKVIVTGGETVTRTFDVTPGTAANLMLSGLPLGPVAFTESAYDAVCSAVVANTPATWVSAAPIQVTLQSGQMQTVTIVLRRPGGANVTNDFQTGGLSVNPTSADFGSLLVGTGSASRAFTFSNATGAPTTGALSVILQGPAAADFQITGNTCAQPLMGGGSCTVTVDSRPTAEGSRAATLSLNDGTASVTANLSATGVAPQLVINPTTFTFGSVRVGDTSSPASFTVANTGTSPTSMPVMTVSDSNFAITGHTCQTPLAPAATCTVSVRFNPTSVGAKSGSLQIAAGATVMAALAGTAVPPAALTVEPATRDFGMVAIGATSGPSGFQVTNTGASASGALLVAVSSADFVITANNCNGASLAPGASCVLQLAFRPTASGARSGSLTLSGAGISGMASLQGTGIPAVSLAINPNTVSFPGTPVGSTSTAVGLTVSNPSGATVSMLQVASPGAEFPFTMNGCTNATLAPGQSCNITVAFTPQAPGVRTAVLNVTGTSGTNMAAVSAMLSGTGLGARLAIEPPTGNLGSVTIGSAQGLSFTLRNEGNAATAPLTLTLATGTQFSFSHNDCNGRTLAAQASCTFTVTFRPTSAGTHNDTATARSGSVSITLPLTGSGLAGVELSITPVSHGYGNVELGLVGRQMFAVRNNGNITGSLATAITSSMAMPDFRFGQNGCAGLQLAPQATCNVEVIFAPTALAQTRTATLNVTGTPHGSTSAALSGTGAASTWSTIDIGGPINGSFNPSGGVFEIRGAGNDVFGASDQFRFVYRYVTGDATLIARVTSVQNVNQWTKAFLMMRDSLLANVRYVGALATPTPGNQYRLQARTSTGGNTSSIPGGTGVLPVWLRLVRSGNNFTASFSADGTAWSPLGGTQTIALPATIPIGFAVTSHNGSQTALATYDNISVTQP